MRKAGDAGSAPGPGRTSLRVAQVLTVSTGGIGRHVAGLAGSLTDRGHTVRVWCPRRTAPLFAGQLGTLPLTAAARIRGADLIHAHGYKASVLAAPIAALLRIPLVTSWHNDIPRTGSPRLVGRLLRRVSVRASATIVGASTDLVDRARRMGVDAALGEVAAPSLGSVGVGRTELRAALGIPDRAVMIITVARLAPQKRLDLVCAVARRLRHRDDLVFVIVGDGPERDRLRRRVAADRLPVRLLGHREDIADLLNAADLALLTSHWEARPLAAQEMLRAGLALVTTRVGGVDELVRDAAVLVGPGDVPAMVEAVSTLADAPARRKALGAAAEERAAALAGAEEIAQTVEQIYRRTLEAR